MKLLVACAFSLMLILAIAALSEISGPVAAQPAASPPPAQPPAGNACFSTRSIRGFRSVDNRTVFVRVSANDIFALELFSPCLGVDWAHRVALRSRGSNRICEGRANWVNLYVRQAGGRQGRCAVSNVRRLAPGEIASLPRGARP
ncbi:MAG TPA: DUF6491 family protein [Caulobacteraceae bacterium]|jgi:hypothetical protein|nr:DUF6491 family protein [Caulobacteraceae bacterium]